MKSVILICPFFGMLPKEYFQIILNSCRNNDSINWLLITNDKTKYNFPRNVKVIYETWEDFKGFVQKKVETDFGIQCVLDKPYKLCDYRPLFGLIFDRYIEEYDYWGNTDFTDVLYGNLRHFLTDKVLTFDKVNFLGHLTLYRNSPEVNNRCKLQLPNGNSIQNILSSSKNFAFDEAGENGIQQIYINYKFQYIYINHLEADISPMRYAFQLSEFDKSFHQYYEIPYPRIFRYKNGKIISFYIKNGKIISEEFGAIHFQKRKMINKLINKDKTKDFLITPSGFVPNNKIDKALIKKNSPHKFYPPFFALKWKAFKIKFARIIEKD